MERHIPSKETRERLAKQLKEANEGFSRFDNLLTQIIDKFDELESRQKSLS